MTFGSIALGGVSGSTEITLNLGDSLIIAKQGIRGQSGPAVNRAVIEVYNQQVKLLFSLFNKYQRYPLVKKYDKELKEFQALADDFRKVPDKPSITKEQRRLIVQANALNDEKQYFRALEKYKQAIELNPVSYPQAYYNMALIASQIENYLYAIHNIKKYLLLVPDAEDARAAQDKIYEWEIKL